MKLDVPHGLRRLPPAPELRRTQDTANPSHKEHIYLYVFYGPIIIVCCCTAIEMSFGISSRIRLY